ncbi:hypothetical protein CYY_001812 [Polysphondylium violaceum]|uniref:GST C-terminal domain-containing protein n=1 Tax=Polysphondylium violaceum TaxID=133409 RepID=A0A8J4Q172_9MYCE|nr:hypothetical protein CYY_001812 [Polysphondylium violaceum]
MATSISNYISNDGTFKPEANRYHLYLGLGCPFAHRAHMALFLKGLEDVISYSCLHYTKDENDLWEFNGKDGSDLDVINGYKNIKELYDKTDPTYAARYTVPVLWDKKNNVIVNNESAQIVVIFNSQFNNIAKHPELNLIPESIKDKIDQENQYYAKNLVFKVYDAVNPDKYSETFDTVFSVLQQLDDKFKSGTKYLLGDSITDADIKLWVLLIRFDVVFYGLYKLNYKLVRDYPNLVNYVKRVYQISNISKTVNFDHIKGIYYTKATLQDKIIPKGPNNDYLNTPLIN